MISIKTILVPVDFSNPSKQAAAYAFKLAKQLGSTLLLAHVVPEPPDSGYVLPESHMVEEGLYEAAKRDLPRLIPPDADPGVRVHTVVRVGRIDAQLLEIVRDNQVDLVVMGSHGRRAFSRWLLGSVTERVLREMPVPVLTIAHQAPPADAPPVSAFNHVVYATDLGEDSPRGLQYAAEIARVGGCRLTIVHVVDLTAAALGGALNLYLHEERERMVARSREWIAALASSDCLKGLQVRTEVVEGKPYQAIVEFAKTHGADLIAINLQSKGVLERAFLGATAERVVRLAPVPVLSIPLSTVPQPEVPEKNQEMASTL